MLGRGESRPAQLHGMGSSPDVPRGTETHAEVTVNDASESAAEADVTITCVAAPGDRCQA